MQVIVLVKATEKSEAGIMPDPILFQEMAAYNQRLIDAGVMQDGNGLQSSDKGKRIEMSPAGNTVIDGPFAEVKELVSGYWIWEVESMDAAVEWALQIPNPTGEMGIVELRKIAGPEDYEGLPDEIIELEGQQRATLEARQA